MLATDFEADRIKYSLYVQRNKLDLCHAIGICNLRRSDNNDECHRCNSDNYRNCTICAGIMSESVH